jgi:hypothetical protein
MYYNTLVSQKYIIQQAAWPPVLKDKNGKLFALKKGDLFR